mmetsp:Transcript_25444/g.59249  ORF Transcript_25444/g.59249 Transcript_25444/m.59249 type:complete len:235 (+) Transcript_25444:1360-2064(+)
MGRSCAAREREVQLPHRRDNKENSKRRRWWRRRRHRRWLWVWLISQCIRRVVRDVRRGNRGRDNDHSTGFRRKRVSDYPPLSPLSLALCLDYPIITHSESTHWSMDFRLSQLGVYVPLGMSYLILWCAEDYSHAVVGVPNRGYAWILSRQPTMEPETMELCMGILARCAYDVSKVVTIEHDLQRMSMFSDSQDKGGSAMPPVLPHFVETDEETHTFEGWGEGVGGQAAADEHGA